jgi:ABC-type multidrug transport system fused ATPase/permease subunit
VTVHEVLIQYEGKLRELQTGITQLRLHHSLVTIALVIAIGMFLLLGLYAVRQQMSFLWPSLPIPVAAACARRYRQCRQAGLRMRRLKSFYDRAVRRVQGHWARSGVTGEEFNDPDHVYATDLHIFGPGSLFELLCITRTSVGRRGLANYLREAPVLDETLLRQGAVRELRERADLRERVATLGEFEFFESKWATFEDWLNSPTLSFAGPLPILTVFTSALLAGIVLAGLLGLVSWVNVATWIAPLVAFHSVTGLIFRRRVNRMHDWVRQVSLETQVLREGLHLLEREPFRSTKLRQLADQVRNGYESVWKLERLLRALNERHKDWFYGPSLLLLAGTQLCMAVEQWRKEHGESLKMWLGAWAEFEALNALAAYAFENPDNTFPEFSSGEARFEAQSLGHPLLPRTSCVTNDVELNQTSRFYMVSGSNMSGKSTLLRAIGLNAVLAFAGAPVRASALRLSGLSVFASLSVVDSLLNGKSKFLAEVDRLRQTIESAVENKFVLFLVDEIFGGTNSRDRRIAAEAVVRTLLNRGAIGAVSTHDLALTEIASSEGSCGVNVHMGSRDGCDPMDFDYRLKPGVTKEANALTIARLAGVPV